MSKIDSIFTFQKKVTVVGQGEPLIIRNCVSAVVDIFGANVATRTVSFYKLNSNTPADLIPIYGLNISTNDYAISTTGIGSETWQFDLVGLNQIIMKITALTGTSAETTIIGTVVMDK